MDARVDPRFADEGQPATRTPTRMMAGLHGLNDAFDLSGAAVCERYTSAVAGGIGRCYLKGSRGDELNALGAALGFNLRKVLKGLAVLACAAGQERRPIKENP